MNCKQFRRDLPDWLRGNSSIDQQLMESHSAGCRECAREEALERHLRGAWRSIPEPARTPEVWPRVAAAINASPQRNTWRPARLAFGSVFALGAICAVLYARMPAPPTGPTSDGQVAKAVDEKRVVEMVQELRQIPDLNSERIAMEPPHMIHEAIFLGNGERK